MRTDLSLVIVGPYPPDPSIIGNGVEAVVVNLVAGLRKVPTIRVAVVSTTDTVASETVVAREDVVTYYLPSARRLSNITLGAVTKARVRQKITQLKPDVVHVHDHTNFPYIGFRRAPCPVVATVHGLRFEETKYETEPLDWLRRPPRRYLERLVLRRSREVIAVSDYVQRAIGPLTRARITVIDNPVAECYFSVWDRRIGRARRAEVPSRATVLFAGGITRRKNVLGLIQAIELLRRDVVGIELRIAGGVRDEQYYETLEHFVSEHSLQQEVRFLGQLSEPALCEEYERCTVVASASHEETAGMIFQQAMAAGVPVVATRAGGIPSIVTDDQSGILIAPDDLRQLAEALRVTLGDPARRSRFADAGRRIALERFTATRAAARTLEVYRGMLAPGRLPDADLPV